MNKAFSKTITMRQPLVLLLFLWVSMVGSKAMAVEEAAFTVMMEEAPFEVRQYEPQIVAETVVDGAFSDAGSKAFDRLFQYISGNNTVQQKVAMTSPVGQTAASEKIAMTAPVGQTQSDGQHDNQWTVSFMMPAAFTMDTIPQPNDAAVSVREIPARHMAAVRYSGVWSEDRYQRHKNQLDAWIVKQGLRAVGEPEWARYDAPFTPWFLRRNEVLIPIAAPPASQ